MRSGVKPLYSPGLSPEERLNGSGGGWGGVQEGGEDTACQGNVGKDLG